MHHTNPMEEDIAPGSSSEFSSNIKNPAKSMSSMRSIGSLVCRICQNQEEPERLISPCSCKGSLSFVHTFCLEHWISTSKKTTCELCHFQYKTKQTLKYTCFESLRLWYSHSISRRALQEDCQMFSLLTLVAFGIIGTIIIGLQHYFVEDQKHSIPPVARLWTKGWLLFFLFATFLVYVFNIYLLAKGQLSPWYRWWQASKEVKLILENHKKFHPKRRLEKPDTIIEIETSLASTSGMSTNLQYGDRIGFEDFTGTRIDGRRDALVPSSSGSEDNTSMTVVEIHNHPGNALNRELATTEASDEMPRNLQDAGRNTPIAEQEHQGTPIGAAECMAIINYAMENNRDAEIWGSRQHSMELSSRGNDCTATTTIVEVHSPQEPTPATVLATTSEMPTTPQDAERNTPTAEQEHQKIAIGATYAIENNRDTRMGVDGRRHALEPPQRRSSRSDVATTSAIIEINNQQEQLPQQQQTQPQQQQNEQLEGHQQQNEDNHIDIN
ncbi:uncharacterized protein LOC129951506 [Eupeodes corollae]|uniref:uncharacterized protein LOC129951506 n=1 Tax=Eupeodes corollae TaxID=290404 RepID=UPI002491E330|nr:uncharacterized protein LOC129951506 [Eupeodes corollae]XP_055919672.1 uncharacterized protein LOC129951506 [Eupeodes corollae]